MDILGLIIIASNEDLLQFLFLHRLFLDTGMHKGRPAVFGLCFVCGGGYEYVLHLILLISSGSYLLSRVLRQSTISVTGFNDRVRNGIGWDTCAITTGTNKQNIQSLDD